MSCLITLKGIPFACDNNLGGVKAIYIADYANITGVVVDQTSQKINNINGGAGKFYTFIPAKNTASLTKTLSKDESAGTLYYTNEVTAQFNKMTTDKRIEMDALVNGQLAVIVLDSNGIYWYLGKDEYCSATAQVGQTGAQRTDGNFYNITITDISSELPFEVDPSIIDELLA